MNLTARRRDVLADLAIRKGGDQAERIARRLEIARTTAQSPLRFLRENGLVQYRSRWELTDAGRAAIRSMGEKGE